MVAFVVTTIYLSLLYGLYVPDWEYQISTEDQGSTTFLVGYCFLSLLSTYSVTVCHNDDAVKTVYLKVKCGVRGDTGPGCNAVGMIDRMLLGIQHLYRKPVYARTKVLNLIHVSVLVS